MCMWDVMMEDGRRGCEESRRRREAAVGRSLAIAILGLSGEHTRVVLRSMKPCAAHFPISLPLPQPLRPPSPLRRSPRRPLARSCCSRYLPLPLAAICLPIGFPLSRLA